MASHGVLFAMISLDVFLLRLLCVACFGDRILSSGVPRASTAFPRGHLWHDQPHLLPGACYGDFSETVPCHLGVARFGDLIFFGDVPWASTAEPLPVQQHPFGHLLWRGQPLLLPDASSLIERFTAPSAWRAFASASATLSSGATGYFPSPSTEGLTSRTSSC